MKGVTDEDEKRTHRSADDLDDGYEETLVCFNTIIE